MLSPTMTEGFTKKKAIVNLIPIQVFFIAVLFTRRKILQNYRSLPDGLHVAKKEKNRRKLKAMFQAYDTS
jgi:hypothetical protein